ncbi:hypothetical protein [Flavilitoribacter nigricans]|uniref:Uncharacterized protein n=1 Tax=Flavilitoribacter nigricans (strain ATCC 23147 / DSM 23189 / NBRC 102662 / NCIMB 1420 / SS-2) TaxID=1122177 RepID=A0A2D0N645_FLAN2|nr:hypothetical protein [Flavilitoribacter nigricans]PHN03243.1 hypothetical protein CRP01_28015 [Flavilitoribacter nigricans DSM 23189 = NBRC 102662]
MKVRVIQLPANSYLLPNFAGLSANGWKLILALLLLLGSTLTASAQPNKVDGALHSFLNSDFMVKMNDMKIEAEAAVRAFKQQSTNLDPNDVKKVRVGYDQTAARFNQVLTNIKADFLNPKKLKFISKFPDDYLKGLELELYQLSDFYAVNFQQPLADAQAENVDGGAVFLIISELIGLTKGLFTYFGQIRQNSRQYNEAYLQQHFYKPYRMRLWDEVNQGGFDSYNNYNNNNYSDPTYMNTPTQDMTLPANEVPFPEINLQSLDNLNQQDQYQQTDTYDEWLDTNETDPNQQSDAWMEDPNFQPGSAPADSTNLKVVPNQQPQSTTPAKTPAKPNAKKKKNG